ncbi:alpha/beta fold hydrolase [Frankia sp. AgKG'84/4]|uniref:alpha/beta fold hydrolase n=1 Tax=Frankia sp. AgKG'84/4 TaxID=573490 RepID=UPI002029B68E|nr:alpha/beta fold hydrolase [Frankia sp. AgKG'84/4]MCL9792920.1 alpha/beta fold hydrolase [Frankia sp. AgKG'84/4]
MIWTESFGRPADPAILLVMGGPAQGIAWPDALCRRLADSGYLVVRYDHRDVGLSTKTDFRVSCYDLSTLAGDAADVITGLGLASAHVVGQSAGGIVAQLLALDEPSLVRSLVLLSCSPDANGDVHLPPRTGLPGPGQPLLDHVAGMTDDPPTTRAARVAAAVRGWRVFVGTGAPFSETYWRDLVERSMRREAGSDLGGNHLRALDRTPPLTARIGAIQVPTLVVHGRRDDVFPLAHGEALAGAIAAARLMVLDDLGHIFPPQWCPLVHGLVTRHLREAEAAARPAGRVRSPGVNWTSDQWGTTGAEVPPAAL